MPSQELIAKMMKYNEELAKAGVLLALDGLHPPQAGARFNFHGGKATVKDGPFTEATEVIGGYWLLQCKSRAEAIEWLRRCPAHDGDTIELRQVYDMADYGPELQSDAVERVATAVEKNNRS